MIRVFYILKLLARGLTRRPWGSLVTLIACWFAMCQMVLVFHAVSFTSQARTLRGASSTVMAYLSGRQQESTLQEIRGRIAAMSEVNAVEFIPCRQGFDRLRQWLGPDGSLVEDLDPGVLPDAFEVRLKPAHTGSIAGVAARIGEIPQVEDVRYDRGILGRVADAYYPIVIAGMGVILAVVLSLSLVVFLSIRVGMVSRRQEMEVLHLLGARRYFLHSPYLLEALGYGAGGAALALLTIEGIRVLLAAQVPVLGDLLAPMRASQMILVITLPGFLSLLGARLAIRQKTDD
ncbi:MAG TPA: permease-like cell division protein FtsX [Deltaproteobacteria bacterium]|nr:permease-like cell division protein FtsX [Deltaproteobacteria bacterium]